MGSLGTPEVLLILALALLLFGPKRLPDLAKSLGRAIAEFKKASTDMRQTIEKEVEDLKQQEQPSLKDQASLSNKDISTSDNSHKTGASDSGDATTKP